MMDPIDRVSYEPEISTVMGLLMGGVMAFIFWHELITTYYEIKAFEGGYEKVSAIVDSRSTSNWKGVHYSASYHYQVNGVWYWGSDGTGSPVFGTVTIIYAKSDPSVSRIRVLPPTWEQDWYGIKYMNGGLALFCTFGLMAGVWSYIVQRHLWWRLRHWYWASYFSPYFNPLYLFSTHLGQVRKKKKEIK